LRRKDLGRVGEDIAASFLESQGYRILKRNYFCRFGEIDIVAEKDGTVYFVEVRTLKSNLMQSPLETLTASKMRRFRKAVQWFTTVEKIKANYRTLFIGLKVSGDEVEIVPVFDFLEE
jgi:putative endonuclease